MANYRSEFFLKVPTVHKTKDLSNYKLLFFVYVPQDNEKVHFPVTEFMVEQEPMRYNFYPIQFARLPLLQGSSIIGGRDKDLNLSLMKYTPKKYLHE
jgi:hypothetical protein